MTVVEAFVANPYSSSPSPRTFAQKMLRRRRRERLFEPTLRGCSSVVEHLLAKEDVASSSLVTRSSLRLVRSAKGRLERARRSHGEGGPPESHPGYGWQASSRFYCVLRLHF